MLLPLAPFVLAAAIAQSELLLAELERAGESMRDFQSAISYEKYDALLDESERRFGSLVLEGSGRSRRFAFVFTRFIDGSGKADESVDHWVYADGWLVELDHRHRTFTKRQIVEPGRDFDPLKLGEGPFPLPFGQAKDEVLARFLAWPAEPPAIPMLRSLSDVRGLRLVPREGTELAKDTRAIEIFYDARTLAPRGLNIEASSGDRTSVLLSRPVVNGGLSSEDAALLSIDEPTSGWDVDIRPWRGRTP